MFFNRKNVQLMSLEDQIRKIVIDEISKRERGPSVELVPVKEFCERQKIRASTLWRHEKLGKIKLSRIGKRVFVDQRQFAAA